MTGMTIFPHGGLSKWLLRGQILRSAQERRKSCLYLLTGVIHRWKLRAGNMIKKGLTEEQENTFYPLLHHLNPPLMLLKKGVKDVD